MINLISDWLVYETQQSRGAVPSSTHRVYGPEGPCTPEFIFFARSKKMNQKKRAREAFTHIFQAVFQLSPSASPGWGSNTKNRKIPAKYSFINASQWVLDLKKI